MALAATYKATKPYTFMFVYSVWVIQSRFAAVELPSSIYSYNIWLHTPYSTLCTLHLIFKNSLLFPQSHWFSYTQTTNHIVSVDTKHHRDWICTIVIDLQQVFHHTHIHLNTLMCVNIVNFLQSLVSIRSIFLNLQVYFCFGFSKIKKRVVCCVSSAEIHSLWWLSLLCFRL